MKYGSFSKWVSAMFLVAITVSVGIGCLQSCSSTKNIDKERSSKDSVYVANLERQLNEAQLLVKHYEQVIKEYENYSLSMNDDCDTIINKIVENVIKSGCDSAAIDRMVTELNGLKNKVKILKDGTIEAEGKIKSITATKSRLEKTLEDTRSEVHRKEQEIADIKAELKTEQEKKNKVVKVKVMPGYMWWLIVAGFVGGCWFWGRFGAKVKSIFKQNKRS